MKWIEILWFKFYFTERYLHFYRYGISLGNTVGAGNGTIWLDDMSCTGNELRLADCQNSGWGEHNCAHSEDVGIKCSNDG